MPSLLLIIGLSLIGAVATSVPITLDECWAQLYERRREFQLPAPDDADRCKGSQDCRNAVLTNCQGSIRDLDYARRLQQEVNGLKGKVTTLQTDAEHDLAEITRLRQSVQTLEGTVAEQAGKLIMKESIETQLRSQMSVLNSTNWDLNNTIQNYLSTGEKTRNETPELSQQTLEELKLTIDMLNDTIQRHPLEVEKIRNETDRAYQQQLNEARGMVARFNRTKSLCEKEKTNLSRVISELQESATMGTTTQNPAAVEIVTRPPLLADQTCNCGEQESTRVTEPIPTTLITCSTPTETSTTASTATTTPTTCPSAIEIVTAEPSICSTLSEAESMNSSPEVPRNLDTVTVLAVEKTASSSNLSTHTENATTTWKKNEAFRKANCTGASYTQVQQLDLGHLITFLVFLTAGFAAGVWVGVCSAALAWRNKEVDKSKEEQKERAEKVTALQKEKETEGIIHTIPEETITGKSSKCKEETQPGCWAWCVPSCCRPRKDKGQTKGRKRCCRPRCCGREDQEEDEHPFTNTSATRYDVVAEGEIKAYRESVRQRMGLKKDLLTLADITATLQNMAEDVALNALNDAVDSAGGTLTTHNNPIAGARRFLPQQAADEQRGADDAAAPTVPEPPPPPPQLGQAPAYDWRTLSRRTSLQTAMTNPMRRDAEGRRSERDTAGQRSPGLGRPTYQPNRG